MKGTTFLALLVVLCTPATSAVQQPATGRTVAAQQGAADGLISLLKDESVGRIIINSNYTIANELTGPVPGGPIRLQRNVTIEGKPGAEPPVTLDLAFKRAVVLLCPTCTVTLRNLTLRNARRGSGAGLDFFVGDDQGGQPAVLLEGVYRHRLACTPGSDTAEVLANTQRSRVLPGPEQKQAFKVMTVNFQGVTYPDALQLQDFSQDFPLTHQEGRGHSAMAHFGGYALGSRNVLYLCEHLVSEACLAEKQPDACVNELIDAVLAQKSSRSQGLSGPLLAAIIVPIVVVGALLAGLAVWLLRRRSKQLAPDPEAPPHKLSYDTGDVTLSFISNHQGPGPKGDPHGGAAKCIDSGSGCDSAVSKSHHGRRSLEIAMQPRGLQQGWQLVSSATAAFVQEPTGAEAEVQFGRFLGAGSYGRVYRARWAGRDVACKVIEHDQNTLAAVEAEADLMLALNHPNVVKAYHYCTFTYTYTEPAHSDKGSRGSRLWGQGQLPSSSGSHSSGLSSGVLLKKQGSGSEFAQQLNNNPDANSGSGSSAHVLLLRRRQQQQQQSLQPPLQQPSPQQQQQQQAYVQRQESLDVLVTNLSFDTQGEAAPAAAVAPAGGIAAGAANAAVSTKSASQGKDLAALDGTQLGEQDSLQSGAALKHKAETWLVQEFCDLGTLGGIASSWDPADECDEQMLERLYLLRDTARGLQALHDNHVVHGDVNARNVLVSSCGSSATGACAKVADLGLARCLSQHATHRTTNTCGTLSHMAPELLRYGRLSPAVDIYAFGVMMWEMYNQGQPAFDKLHYGQFFETVVLRKVRPCVPQGMPPDYELLMRQCWADDPAERPSVAVLQQCLQLMLDDREGLVTAAAAALAAAAAAPAAVDASAHTCSASAAVGAAAAAAEQPKAGASASVLAALQELLPGQPRGGSPAGPPTPHLGPQQGAAAAAAGASGALQSPGASSPALSVVSLSELFPDSTPGSPTVSTTTTGVQGSAAATGSSAAAATGSSAAAAAAAGPAGVRKVVVGGSGRETPPPVSPISGGEVESPLLDKDPTVHNTRLWFV